ncbi:MAG: cytochrome c peroxidase [Methylococcales bacterium]|nr:cytochrome c peroxidase [Methylococcales bacterium]
MRIFLQLYVMMSLLFSSSVLADKMLGLPPLLVPEDNPQTAGKIALGRLLFNDKRFSANDLVSCSSCHHADKAFTDGLPVAIGINGQAGVRNVPTIINAAFYQAQFLDGRASTLEEQALGPFVNPIEHGLISHQVIVDVIRNDPEYLKLFNKVFNVTINAITIDYVVKAIASFERTLISGNSAFDRYLFGRDQSAISVSAARGFRIFRRKGNCANCHEISWDNALFTDNRFYNIGVGFKRLTPVLEELIAGKSPEDMALTDVQRSELGRFKVTKTLADLGKFKTPALRNIALTAPYMHDGSLKTLEAVIEHYDKGGDNNRFIDAKIFPLNLTKQEKADLLAFMQTLTSMPVK